MKKIETSLTNEDNREERPSSEEIKLEWDRE